MRCQLCGDRAGFWRRRCRECRSLWAVWLSHRLDGMRGILTALAGTGIPEEKIQRFLAAEPRKGHGTLKDLIAADMTNQLLESLGQRGQQQGTDVKQLRERGAWKTFDQRPPE